MTGRMQGGIQDSNVMHEPSNSLEKGEIWV